MVQNKWGVSSSSKASWRHGNRAFLKQRLRKRTRETSATATTSDRSKKRKIDQPEVSSPSSSRQCTKSCSLKSCGKVINPRDDTQVEVKVALTEKSKEFLSKCLVEWKIDSGEAQFHGRCWTFLEKTSKTSKTRGRQTNQEHRMSKGERVLVKDAAETAEWHDSEVNVNREAAKIASLIAESTYCIAFTGAGISTSAGIGDYRGKDGKWTEMDRAQDKDDVEQDEGVPYESLRPTYTHEALVKLMGMGFLKHVISQNGDGLHGLSGIPLEHMSELHGNVFVEVCEKCGYRYHRSYYVLDDTASQYYEEIEDFGRTSVKKPKHAKLCELCGMNHRTGRRCEQQKCKGFLKDSIINFKDNLEETILSNAEVHAKRADLCLSLGTTMKVTPACELVEMGKKPLRLMIVNRQKTPLDHIALSPSPDDGTTLLGSRAYGDTDHLMKAVMKHLMPESELLLWETSIRDRLKNM